MIKDLDNTEISCVYYQFKTYLEDIDHNLNAGIRTDKITLDIGATEIQPIVLVKITSEEVAAIRSSHFYKTVKSIVDKLQPVVELIEEAEPDIKTKLDE